MKFILIVTDDRGAEWQEDYDKPHVENIEEANEWGIETIKDFNRFLRPHELPRTLVRVELPEDTDSDEHLWRKTNLMTVMNKYFGSHDTMKCEKCGITGKRFGLGSIISRDREFKAMGYESCIQSVILLKRRQAMRNKKRYE